jgi:hypothetical protein
MTKNHQYNSIRSVLRRLSVCAGLGLTAASFGAVNVGDVQIGGFFSQGYLKSTENNYPIDTKDGTADFREMGLNGSTTFGSHLRVGAQLFAQTLGKYGNDKVNLDWAVVDYSFTPALGLRVGRVKMPRSLYSDVLDLDDVRPFILLPQSIYDARLRDFQKSFDGALAYGSVSAGKNTFDYKAFFGKLPMRTDSGAADFFNTTGLYANPGLTSLKIDHVYGAALMWGTPITGLRIGLNYSNINSLVTTGPFRQVPSLTSSISLSNFRYENFSVEYTRGPWTLTGEYLISDAKLSIALPSVLGIPASDEGYGQRAWYVSAARRFGDSIEVGTYYTELTDSYPSDPGSPAHRRDLTAAVRLNVTEHILFKLEAHSINGTLDMFNVPGIANPRSTLKDSMMLFAAKTTLSF